MDAWPASSGEALHTSTMLGNPVGCAMALASIREHEKDTTAAAARRTGRTLRLALEALSSPHIGQVRGVGSMLGVELIKTDGSPFPQLSVAIMYQGLKDGLILLGGGPAGNVLSFSPPFVVSEDEIGYLREKLQEYLMSLPGSIS
jgi:4-aminobutyrate aminotransferase-like enzyme